MEMNILLSLLMLFGIFFQGSESLSERNIGESSDRYVRKRRIIDTSLDRNETFLHQEVPYVVRILDGNLEIVCTGIILKPSIILTAAHCVYNLKIYVATGKRMHENTQVYLVKQKFIHEQYMQHLKINDLAMVLINAPIDLIRSFHRPIELYEGHLPPNSHGLVTGWGCTSRNSPQKPLQALSILVPIISLQQCQRDYENVAQITPLEICTHSVNRTKCCWFGDSGGPLVVGGRLVGIFACTYENNLPQFPDVFVNLLDTGYRRWIRNWTSHILRHLDY